MHRRGAGLEILHDLLLVARLGMDHVPTAGTIVGALPHGGRLPVPVPVEQIVLVEHLDHRLGGGRSLGLGRGITSGQQVSSRVSGKATFGHLVNDCHGLFDRTGGQEVGRHVDGVGGGFGFFGGAHQPSNSSRTDWEKIQSRPATTAVMARMVMMTTVV